MADDIPFEEKVANVKGFIRNAPPGELSQIVKDLNVVLEQKVDAIEGVPETIQNYHQDQLTTCFTDPEKQKKYQNFLKAGGSNRTFTMASGDGESEFVENNGEFLISRHGKIENNTFYEPNKNIIFDFDPVTQIVSNVSDKNLSVASAEPLRKALQKSATDYVAHHYPKGVSTVYCKKDSKISSGKEYILLIEDHEYQPQNRWNGSWRSEWMISCNNNGKIVLEGGSKVHVHYYEDSNVQLVTKQIFDEVTIEGLTSEDSDEKIATSAIKVVKKLETRYQQALRDNYVTMDDTTFKTLRRKLPINQQKFNWDHIDHLRIGSEIKKN